MMETNRADLPIPLLLLLLMLIFSSADATSSGLRVDVDVDLLPKEFFTPKWVSFNSKQVQVSSAHNLHY